MAAKDRYKNKSCFIPFVIPEWHTDEKYTLRSFTPDEQADIQTRYEKFKASETGDPDFMPLVFSRAFGDEGGNRVFEDSDLEEIRQNIPQLVINRVAKAGLEFSNDAIKKN